MLCKKDAESDSACASIYWRTRSWWEGSENRVMLFSISRQEADMSCIAGDSVLGVGSVTRAANIEMITGTGGSTDEGSVEPDRQLILGRFGGGTSRAAETLRVRGRPVGVGSIMLTAEALRVRGRWMTGFSIGTIGVTWNIDDAEVAEVVSWGPGECR